MNGTGEKLRLAAVGLAIAVLLIGIFLLLAHSSRATRTPAGIRHMEQGKVTVEAAAFQPYFTIEQKATAQGGRLVILRLRRTEAFPLDDHGLDLAVQRSSKTPSELLAIQALGRGYVRCEFFDEKGNFLGFALARIKELRRKEAVELSLQAPSGCRTRRIVITF